jgi:hypothetical protein
MSTDMYDKRREEILCCDDDTEIVQAKDVTSHWSKKSPMKKPKERKSNVEETRRSKSKELEDSTV